MSAQAIPTIVARLEGRAVEVARAAARVRRPLLVGTAAISAGVHAGLVSSHLDDERMLGTAFAAAAVSLALVAAWLLRSPTSAWPARAAAALFVSLIAAYFVTRAGQPVDVLGVLTKLVEATGLALALSLRPAAGEARAERPGTRWLYLLLALLGSLLALHGHAGHSHGVHSHDDGAHVHAAP